MEINIQKQLCIWGTSENEWSIPWKGSEKTRGDWKFIPQADPWHGDSLQQFKVIIIISKTNNKKPSKPREGGGEDF